MRGETPKCFRSFVITDLELFGKTVNNFHRSSKLRLNQPYANISFHQIILP